jgi:hypothetical protein
MVLAVVLLAASSATAGYKPGNYRGTTDQACGRPDAPATCPIAFKAKKLVVKKFSFTAVMSCDDGIELQVPLIGAQAPTSKKGRFKATFLIDAPIRDSDLRLNGTTILKGKLKRRRGSGELKGEATRTDGVFCSGSGSWTATKQ